jgi:ABC-type Fe3+-hydroxamate transport system substrate-binding protein
MKNTNSREAQERDKSAKFIELANKRVNRAVKDIALIGNLSNRRNYTYNEEQAKKIIKALQASVDQVKASFHSGIQGQEANFEL